MTMYVYSHCKKIPKVVLTTYLNFSSLSMKVMS